MNRSVVVVTVGLTLQWLTQLSATDHWPQFRGSQSGIADDDPSLPETWSETENVVWRIDLPGQGWSSPVVWDDHVFVTTAISSGAEPAPPRGIADPTAESGQMRSSATQRWVVYDIDFKTGNIRWEREVRSGPPPIARQVRNSQSPPRRFTSRQRAAVDGALPGRRRSVATDDACGLSVPRR